LKRLSFGGVAKAMQHKPSCFLRDFNIFGKLRTGDSFFMTGYHPNSGKPLAKLDFTIVKDSANLD